LGCTKVQQLSVVDCVHSNISGMLEIEPVDNVDIYTLAKKLMKM